MKKNLTEKQEIILGFLRDFFEREDRLPTTREITREFGWKSQTAAMSHLRALERHGELEHRSNDSKPFGWWRFPRPSEITLIQ